jgi:hypothetical protein
MVLNNLKTNKIMETLEEATKKYANKNGDIPTTELEDAIFKQGFIDGAKWQQEKSYSEEEVLELIQFLSDKEDFKENSLISIFIAEDFLNQFKNK